MKYFQSLLTHWSTYTAVIGTVVSFLTPSINEYIKANPHATFAVLLGAALMAWHAQAPADKAAANSGSASTKVVTLFLLSLCLLGMSHSASAQNTPIPTQTFSFTSSAISLPGDRGTFAGTDSGVSFAPTPNFALQEANILSSDARLAAFMGFGKYDFPWLSNKLNNISPLVSGFRMKFGIRAGMGIDRVKDASGNVAQHYAALAQGTFAYSFDSGGTWQFGANIGMARFPGYAKGWTPVAEVGPQFHF